MKTTKGQHRFTHSHVHSTILAVALAFSGGAFAAANKPVITSVLQDANLVTIRGVGFVQNKGPLQVSIMGSPVPLSVMSYTDTTIIAVLPAGMAPGSYQLSLDGQGSHDDDFYVTYGAQGPKGDKGDRGDAGAPGATGQT